MKPVNTKFYSLWFDPIGNGTRVYPFSGKRSIHSTKDRLKTCNTLESFKGGEASSNCGNLLFVRILELRLLDIQ